MKITAAFVLSLAVIGSAQVQQKPTAPPDDHAAMMKRGDHAMGFSHEKTTHHFRLFKDGGAIEVAANDPKDTASRDEIRQHLAHISQMFAAGNFNVPMLIHATTPPGVQAMRELREQIDYLYQDTIYGARIRITTADSQAQDAIHAFLRFQITEHETGDATAVTDEIQKK